MIDTTATAILVDELAAVTPETEAAAMVVLVIGYCDCRPKLHGMSDVVLFAEDDQFWADRVPSRDEVRDWAQQRGYYPSGMIGAVSGLCDPVYRYVRRLPPIDPQRLVGGDRVAP